MKVLSNEEKNVILVEIQKTLEIWGQYEGPQQGFDILVRKSFNILGPMLNVGKVDIHLKTVGNAIVHEGLDMISTLYESGSEYEETPMCYDFSVPDRGSFSLHIHMLKGAASDDFISEQIDFLGKMIYSYGGRVRTMLMLGKAITCDIMTGLPNKDSVMRFVGRNIQLGRIGLYNAYFINVRNFKYINKISDHMSGDDTMVQYAQKLAAIADDDEIVGRLGGDNFVAIIKRSETVAFLEGIKGIEVDVRTKSGNRTISLSAIAGGYEIPDDIHNPGEIMNPISIANQMAKQVLHRDVVFYNDSLARTIIDGQRVLVNFAPSLENGEFVAYFQPKISLETGKVCGAEALARWKHEGELIPPAQFIPPLEGDGSICKLDFEILRQTCEIIESWVKNGREPMTVSVNLSRWHLEDPFTADKIIDMVRKYKFDPKYLEFEITETIDYKEYAALTKLITRLRDYGFTTSVDDFGTGYSSLTMLKDFELDVLKLDRAFIAKIGESDEVSRDEILITTVISLARKLNMKVLAEGVETAAQLDFLKSVGCDMVQGFYFSTPISRDDFEKKYIYV
ncbi:MAG: GGDEF domain-containing phosphodiesterase [Lachnospiraceae bacterium]|nr:GGDEF domain-containing phosphodiesterase [Lachnospiraceae bacterium]